MVAEIPCEVIVIDGGSSDGTPDAVRRRAVDSLLDLRLIEQPGHGPAARRNRAIESARAPVCLFLNDDTWPRPGLLRRHRDFHRSNPERQDALLGTTVLPPNPPPTPFMRWYADAHFDYAGIEDPANAGGTHFYTSNVSAKTAFLQSVGSFDESITFQHEDIDLGLRLEKCGLRLAYDPEAVVEHHHPLDLESAIDRFRGMGRALLVFTARHPTWPVARPPGAGHRVKATALTGFALARIRTP